MIYAVIMAGGKGERFWPQSRLRTPKQLLSITGDKPMIRETVDRLGNITGSDKILIVTNDVQAPAIKKIVPDLPGEHVIAEPCGRNTAACIALAAAYIDAQDSEAVMVVLPADHVIHDVDSFSRNITDAASVAEQHNALCTIGIEPTFAATGYGYIKADDTIDSHTTTPFYSVAQFTEKPDAETAQQFLDSGNYYWNSGIFVWKNKVFLREVEKHMPELYEGYRAIRNAIGTDSLNDVVAQVYPNLPNISVDYGIMEKADRVIMATSGFDWDDVGSWDAVAKHFEPDTQGNIVRGKFVGVDTRDCIVYSGDKLVAGVGIDNLIVVVTDDAVLLCDKSRAQDVKQIVQQLSNDPEGKDYLI